MTSGCTAKSTASLGGHSGAEGAEGTDLGVAAAVVVAAAAGVVVVVVVVVVAGERSDILLKHYIVPFARLDNGIGIYRFQYNGNEHTTYVGVMAQEVAKIVPSAVSRGDDGYLRVNYDQIGIKFMTWDAWKAQTDRRAWPNDAVCRREPRQPRFMKQAKAAPVGAAFAGHSFSVGALPFRLTGVHQRV